MNFPVRRVQSTASVTGPSPLPKHAHRRLPPDIFVRAKKLWRVARVIPDACLQGAMQGQQKLNNREPTNSRSNQWAKIHC
eukprot:361064-Chlamydomonas_euryale.AAC.10